MTNTTQQPEGISLESLDELLNPITCIDLDKLHPEELEHLHDQLTALAERVELRLTPSRL